MYLAMFSLDILTVQFLHRCTAFAEIIVIFTFHASKTRVQERRCVFSFRL